MVLLITASQIADTLMVGIWKGLLVVKRNHAIVVASGIGVVLALSGGFLIFGPDDEPAIAETVVSQPIDSDPNQAPMVTSPSTDDSAGDSMLSIPSSMDKYEATLRVEEVLEYPSKMIFKGFDQNIVYDTRTELIAVSPGRTTGTLTLIQPSGNREIPATITVVQ